MLLYGFKIDSKCLEIACKHCDIECIKMVLNYKIPITNKHFENLLNSKELYFKKYNWDNIVKPRYRRGYSTEKMELLFKFGYVPTIEDIKLSITNRSYLPNISRFDLKLDSSILQLCHEYNFYPDFNFDIKDKNLITLQKYCQNRNLKTISSYIEQYNIKPDQTCIQNATRRKLSYPIIKYLIDKGCYIDHKCINNIVSNNVKCRNIHHILASYNNFINNKPKYEAPPISTEEDSFELHSFNDKDELFDEVMDLPNNQYVINKRKKQDVPDKYRSQFNIPNKRISFLDLKKDFLKRIKDNQWLTGSNNEFIDIPCEIRTKLNLNLEGFIKFSHLDRLLQLFYS
jgi:hypothetical protein